VSTWILLRGLTREARHWGNFAEAFADEIPDAQLFAPDLPGNGTLNAQESPVRVEAMAEAIRSQLISQGIAPPYHLLAISLGAMVAVDWAARHPDEIHGAVLINTSLRPFSPFYRRLKPGNYLPLLKLAWPGGSDLNRERVILEMTSRHAEQTDELLSNWQAYRRDRPVAVGNALRQLIAALRYRAPLARPPAPLLILSSRNDTLVDSACSRQLAQRWDAPHAVHPSAGHDLPLDDGAWVALAVSRWLLARGEQQRRQSET
jgi:pimeloyl-ACP methyl ester carboxylesterase